ncbi:MAG: BACON domain-containing protein [Pyrinomonadaceae bacterium]
MTVIEHNTGVDMPVAIDSSSRSSDPRTIANTIVYRNRFDRGQVSAAAASASVGIRFTSAEGLPVLRKNYWLNFAKTYTGTLPGAVLEAPFHALEISATAGGSSVEASFALWNAGTSSLNWSATDDAPWLTLAPANGSLDGERNSVAIKLMVDPRNLRTGRYPATIIFNYGNLVKRYTVLLNVLPPAASQ